MRKVFLSGLVLLSLLCPLAAQGTFKDPKDDKEKKEVKDDKSVYEVAGKSFEQWVKVEMVSIDPSRREAAMRNVLLFGPEKAARALPTIISELQKHTALKSIDLSVRVSGITALSAIIGSQKDPDTKQLKAAVAIMKLFLNDNQSIVKYRALQALQQFLPESRTLVNEVVKLTRDTETWETRQSAIQTLLTLVNDAKIAPSDQVVKALEDALHDKSNLVRFAALQGIALLGPRCTPAQKETMKVALGPVSAKDTDPTVQIWSHMCLMTVNQAITDDQLIPITKTLSHPDSSVRLQALQALAMVGADAKKAASIPVIQTLGDPDSNIVMAAIVTLVNMKATNAVPALIKMSEDRNQLGALRKAAEVGIDQIQNRKTEEKLKMEEKK